MDLDYLFIEPDGDSGGLAGQPQFIGEGPLPIQGGAASSFDTEFIDTELPCPTPIPHDQGIASSADSEGLDVLLAHVGFIPVIAAMVAVLILRKVARRWSRRSTTARSLEVALQMVPPEGVPLQDVSAASTEQLHFLRKVHTMWLDLTSEEQLASCNGLEVFRSRHAAVRCKIVELACVKAEQLMTACALQSSHVAPNRTQVPLRTLHQESLELVVLLRKLDTRPRAADEASPAVGEAPSIAAVLHATLELQLITKQVLQYAKAAASGSKSNVMSWPPPFVDVPVSSTGDATDGDNPPLRQAAHGQGHRALSALGSPSLRVSASKRQTLGGVALPLREQQLAVDWSVALVQAFCLDDAAADATGSQSPESPSALLAMLNRRSELLAQAIERQAKLEAGSSTTNLLCDLLQGNSNATASAAATPGLNAGTALLSPGHFGHQNQHGVAAVASSSVTAPSPSLVDQWFAELDSESRDLERRINVLRASEHAALLHLIDGRVLKAAIKAHQLADVVMSQRSLIRANADKAYRISQLRQQLTLQDSGGGRRPAVITDGAANSGNGSSGSADAEAVDAEIYINASIGNSAGSGFNNRSVTNSNRGENGGRNQHNAHNHAMLQLMELHEDQKKHAEMMTGAIISAFTAMGTTITNEMRDIEAARSKAHEEEVRAANEAVQAAEDRALRRQALEWAGNEHRRLTELKDRSLREYRRRLLDLLTLCAGAAGVIVLLHIWSELLPLLSSMVAYWPKCSIFTGGEATASDGGADNAGAASSNSWSSYFRSSTAAVTTAFSSTTTFVSTVTCSAQWMLTVVVLAAVLSVLGLLAYVSHAAVPMLLIVAGLTWRLKGVLMGMAGRAAAGTAIGFIPILVLYWFQKRRLQRRLQPASLQEVLDARYRELKAAGADAGAASNASLVTGVSAAKVSKESIVDSYAVAATAALVIGLYCGFFISAGGDVAARSLLAGQAGANLALCESSLAPILDRNPTTYGCLLTLCTPLELEIRALARTAQTVASLLGL